ncbi:MAG: DUF2953 domain-containing protein [Syntrophomonadaceae bacterium]|nr:DUF2953 domain-containing protein [Syntrophomonadaceae bacterium]
MNASTLTASLIVLLALVFLAVLPFECRVTYWKDWEQTELSVWLGLPFGPWHWQWGPYTRRWLHATVMEDLITDLLTIIIKPRKEPAQIRKQNLHDRYKRLAFYSGLVNGLLKQVKFKQLRWVTEIGLYNPMETALAVGVLWGIKGGALTALRGRTPGYRPELSIKVLPNFQRKGWRSDFICRFEGRLGYYLYTAIKIKLWQRSYLKKN